MRRPCPSRKLHPSDPSWFGPHTTFILLVGIYWRRPVRRRHLRSGHCQLMPTSRIRVLWPGSAIGYSGPVLPKRWEQYEFADLFPTPDEGIQGFSEDGLA